MRSKVLLVSRYTNLFTFYKTFFESMGFTDVEITNNDKDGLNMLIREIKPKHVFIASNFYSIATPYMVGVLRDNFPNLKINVVSTEEFPLELATWFYFHGANSYINLLDGIDEFKRGIRQVSKGEKYFSPLILEVIDSIDEIPDCNLRITRMHKEIIFMLYNGFTWEEIMNNLQIGRATLNSHLNNIYKIFHVHKRNELIKIAISLDIVNKNFLVFNKDTKFKTVLPNYAKTQIEINRRVYVFENKRRFH